MIPDSGFAWQVLAGVRAPLTDNIDVGLKYRMFNATDVNIVDVQGRTLNDNIRTHSILGTLTYNFGAPEVMAPPPPPAASAAASAASAASAGRAVRVGSIHRVLRLG